MLKLFVVIPLIILLSACSSIQYYVDSAVGHLELMNATEDLDDVLVDKKYDHEVLTFLAELKEARLFASKSLALPDNDSYKSFAMLNREYVAWSVVATDEFSTKPEEWCFLVVGCLTYRGYFDLEEARNFAKELKSQGKDVSINGIIAYSTLGWFDDPIVSSMLDKEEYRRVGVLFHELAHQVMYRENSVVFNESFASLVEELGVVKWFEYKSRQNRLNRYIDYKERAAQFRSLLLNTKNKLASLYKNNYSEQKMRQEKRYIFNELQLEYKAWKKHWGGYDGYDKWMAQPLNNANFVLINTYNDLVPVLRSMYRAEDNDFEKFYMQVNRISAFPDDKFNAIIQCMKNESENINQIRGCYEI